MDQYQRKEAGDKSRGQDAAAAERPAAAGIKVPEWRWTPAGGYAFYLNGECVDRFRCPDLLADSFAALYAEVERLRSESDNRGTAWWMGVAEARQEERDRALAEVERLKRAAIDRAAIEDAAASLFIGDEGQEGNVLALYRIGNDGFTRERLDTRMLIDVVHVLCAHLLRREK